MAFRRLILGLAVALSLAGSAASSRGQVSDNDAYLDDRSSAAALIRSLYNAINRHEYARAWDYWDVKPNGMTYDQFVAGYESTAAVHLLTGEEFQEGAAGSLYFTLPVAIEVVETDGTTKVFAGCYWLRLAQPANQEPPFTPLLIIDGKLRAATAPFADAVPAACDEFAP